MRGNRARKMGREPLLDLAIARIGFLRPREKLSAALGLRSAAALAGAELADLEALAGRRFRACRFDPRELLRAAEGDLVWLGKRGARVLLLGEEGYPTALAEIYDPPFLLFARGELPDWDGPAVAVVGTRRPSMESARAAYFLAEGLAKAGVAVVSGLALGVDCRAHAGSLAGGGKTVAVLGCGIDALYPARNASLGGRILESGGCVLSEHPPGTPPAPFRFPERNRIISGLSEAAVIVEAPAGSGALYTADFALEQGREVAVLAGRDGNPRGAGCAALARDGAPIVGNAGEVLALLGAGRVARGLEPAPRGAGSAGRQLDLGLAGAKDTDEPGPRGPDAG